jgi:hypothetical protein
VGSIKECKNAGFHLKDPSEPISYHKFALMIEKNIFNIINMKIRYKIHQQSPCNKKGDVRQHRDDYYIKYVFYFYRK